jgi:hypothetical protein
MISEKAIISASVFMLILCLSTTPSLFLSQLWIVTVCCLEEIQKTDEQHIETALGQCDFVFHSINFCLLLVMDDIYFVQLCFLQWLCRRAIAWHL